MNELVGKSKNLALLSERHAGVTSLDVSREKKKEEKKTAVGCLVTSPTSTVRSKQEWRAANYYVTVRVGWCGGWLLLKNPTNWLLFAAWWGVRSEMPT
jgi:hypothetical protein